MPEITQNPLWEKYCINRASGMNKADSYEYAGYSRSSAAPIQLEKKPEIKERIHELKLEIIQGRREAEIKHAISVDLDSDKPILEQLGITEAYLLTNLQMNMVNAQDAGNYAAANKALEMIIKVMGYQAQGINQKSPSTKLNGDNPLGSNFNELLALADKLQIPQAIAASKEGKENFEHEDDFVHEAEADDEDDECL